jgi:hypothetical protein
MLGLSVLCAHILSTEDSSAFKAEPHLIVWQNGTSRTTYFLTVVLPDHTSTEGVFGEPVFWIGAEGGSDVKDCMGKEVFLHIKAPSGEPLQTKGTLLPFDSIPVGESPTGGAVPFLFLCLCLCFLLWYSSHILMYHPFIGV